MKVQISSNNLEDENDFTINSVKCYKSSEKKAEEYFALLNKLVSQRIFGPFLNKRFLIWQKKHINILSYFPFFNTILKPQPKNINTYVKWLNRMGKLEKYLNRSIAYILMRDLGKNLSLPDTQKQIENVVRDLQQKLLDQVNTRHKKEADENIILWLYKKSQKENVELTVIWVLEKINLLAKNLPIGMDKENAKRKLIKIIIGVLMHEIDNMEKGIMQITRTKRIEKAIRLGYAYGLTYPLIDDLLDSHVLSRSEKDQYSNMIRTTLVTGSVPKLGKWMPRIFPLMKYIHTELKTAFNYIKENQKPEMMKSFFEQAYVFFNSQEVDRSKDLSNPNYTNEEIYIPIILKSSASRLIARSVISAGEDDEFYERTFFYGIYNQLADDFSDMDEDQKANAFTPYTYYLKYHQKRPDLINPYELYWTVIYNLIHNVYNSDSLTCEVILDRAVNSLKRFKERVSSAKFKKVMDIFAPNDQEFTKIITRVVKKATDVDFFDKLLRDQMINDLKNQGDEQEYFKETMQKISEEIDLLLNVKKNSDNKILNNIVEAANFSLQSGGKHIRAIIAYDVGVNGYNLNSDEMQPLLKSLEYLHTASLIFDDLPSQDNANIRRGKPTLHIKYNEATAELTALFLTQKAVEEQTNLHKFKTQTVLKLIQYSARLIQDICKGQDMDLSSKSKKLSIEDLRTLSYYKTGLAFEAALVMPAILANDENNNIEILKKFAYHMGVAFQIKDDLLDFEGDYELLGKTIKKDFKNSNATFVTIMGIDEAKKELWNQYSLAMDLLTSLSINSKFLRQLLNYIINRDH